MAGTINLSLSQQFDSEGIPLSGGRLYFYQAGTNTPQNAYSDTPLTIALPNPITLDASGRIQQFFLADGNIKIRLDDKNGQTILAADNLLVIGPSAGGGGVASIDATTVLTTGDMKIVYGTGALTGFVRCNGRTIGSATSGASERANADAQALFLYLYGVDVNLAVSTGRGASAAADWAANKTIALPDWRGRAIGGLSDMGNSDNGILANSVTTLGPTVLGGSGGVERYTIGQANLPNVNFTNSGITLTNGGNTGIAASGVFSPAWQGFSVGTGSTIGALHGGDLGVVLTNQSGPNTFASNSFANSTVVSVNIDNQGNSQVSVSAQGHAASGGSGTQLVTLSPTRLTTIYIKL